MAISLPHYRALQELKRRDALPRNPAILEIGEANIYDQHAFAELRRDLRDVGGDLVAEAEAACRNQGEWLAYDLVKLLYRHLMGACRFAAIDLHGTPAAVKLDLNTTTHPVAGFELVYNHGTAEHIFNIANVFRLMHDACQVRGLMIHESPFTGWVDHGFYNLQPTLFWDVAAANNYQVELMLIEQIEPPALIEISNREQLHEVARAGRLPANGMLFVALRKLVAAPFRVPIQGVYGGTVSAATREAWRELR